MLQPTSMKIGRRPVYILGTLLNLIGCILGGIQTNVTMYYIVNILTGFGAAPVDSLVQISTTDIFFAHERGTKLSWFAFALGTGSYMGPVAAGYITQSQNWNWCFWYLVVFFGIILVLQIFTLEESIFLRPLPAAFTGLLADPERIVTSGVELRSEDDDFHLNSSPQSKTLAEITSTEYIGRMTYWQRISLFHTKQANPKPWWILALFPFRLITFPAIMWTGVLGGLVL
jgi:MFS family permease